jgi:hypothetical protein
VINERNGVLAGVAGGIVFGMLMAMMGMLPMIAQLVGSDSAVVGGIVHLSVDRRIGLPTWSRLLLETVSSKCLPLYRGINVEAAQPTPQRLAEKKGKISTELFVSRRLLDGDDSLDGQLRKAFSGGDAEIWANGVFYSGWAPHMSRSGIQRPWRRWWTVGRKEARVAPTQVHRGMGDPARLHLRSADRLISGVHGRFADAGHGDQAT